MRRRWRRSACGSTDCHWLLELAAARLRLLSLPVLLARLSWRLPLLTGGAQTLHNALAWSYGLLSEQEQQFFRALAIFVGGCHLQVAEAFCASISIPSPLDGIVSLLDRSLIQRIDGQGEHEPRLCMLETVREYGLEVLHAHGAYDLVRHAYARCVFHLAKGAEHFCACEVGTPAVTWKAGAGTRESSRGLALVYRTARCGPCPAVEQYRCPLLVEAGLRRRGQTDDRWKPKQSMVRVAALTRARDIAWRQGDFAHSQAILEESTAISGLPG